LRISKQEGEQNDDERAVVPGGEPKTLSVGIGVILKARAVRRKAGGLHMGGGLDSGEGTSSREFLSPK